MAQLRQQLHIASQQLAADRATFTRTQVITAYMLVKSYLNTHTGFVLTSQHPVSCWWPMMARYIYLQLVITALISKAGPCAISLLMIAGAWH